jgi:hypothetical protein
VKYVLPRIRAFTSIHALVLALTVMGAASPMAGQAGTDETVIQRARAV